MSCSCANHVVLNKETNTVHSLEDERIWVDPLNRACPEDQQGAVWYDPGTKCCTDGKYWWHLPFKKSAQLVIDLDQQPPKDHLKPRDSEI